MKTFKILFIGILISFFAINNVKAQTFQETYDEIWERVMEECDGDYLSGPATIHYMYHLNKDGNVDWFKSQTHSDNLVSVNTGEIFKLSQTVKQKIKKPGGVTEFTFHQNLVGNLGTIYHIAKTFEIDTATNTWTLIKEKVQCF